MAYGFTIESILSSPPNPPGQIRLSPSSDSTTSLFSTSFGSPSITGQQRSFNISSLIGPEPASQYRSDTLLPCLLSRTSSAFKEVLPLPTIPPNFLLGNRTNPDFPLDLSINGTWGHRTSDSRSSSSCKECRNFYVNTTSPKCHEKSHERMFECGLCEKVFTRKWLLAGHMRTHTGEKPFECPRCQRAFADRSNMRAHLQTHLGVKRCQCPHCPRSFTRANLLSRHVKKCIGKEVCENLSE